MKEGQIEEKGFVATIGFFDGVHRGHRFLIDRLTEDARQNGMQSMVITFDKHPRQVLQADYRPMLLTTLDERIELLEQTGVDKCEVLTFDKELAALSARTFMERVLRDRLHVRRLYIGYDHRFGHNRTEGFDDYVAYGRELGIAVERSDSYSPNGMKVSSSAVRALLEEGKTDEAAQCLGRPYGLHGTVTNGERIGRKLGFPTANLLTDKEKLIPAAGVYAVKVCREGRQEMLPGMMNIGTRPTFHGTQQTLEVHILNFNDNLYDCRLQVFFGRRLREERTFDSAEALKTQLEADAAAVRKLLFP